MRTSDEEAWAESQKRGPGDYLCDGRNQTQVAQWGINKRFINVCVWAWVKWRFWTTDPLPHLCQDLCRVLANSKGQSFGIPWVKRRLLAGFARPRGRRGRLLSPRSRRATRTSGKAAVSPEQKRQKEELQLSVFDGGCQPVWPSSSLGLQRLYVTLPFFESVFAGHWLRHVSTAASSPIG